MVKMGYTVTKTQIKIELKKVGHTLALYFFDENAKPQWNADWL